MDADRILMVIRLVAQGHTLLPEHPAALPVNVQAGLDGVRGGLFLEDAAHVVEQPEDTAGGIRVGCRPLSLCLPMRCSFWLGAMCLHLCAGRHGRSTLRCRRRLLRAQARDF